MARRRNGKDLNELVQTALATYKMLGDADFQKKRTELYDARIAELKGKSADSKALSDPKWLSFLKDKFGGGASAESGSGSGSRFAGGGGPTQGEMLSHLTDKGATPREAQFLTAAAKSESSFTPGAIHDGGTGYGMFGHRDPTPGEGRKTDLFNFAGTRTPDWKQQSEFALKELRASPQGKMVNEAKTPEDMTRAQAHFLRPQGYTPNNPENSLNYEGRLRTMRGLEGLAPAKSKVEGEAAPKPKVEGALPLSTETQDQLQRTANAPVAPLAAIPVSTSGDEGADDQTGTEQPESALPIGDAVYRPSPESDDVRLEDAGYTGSAPDLGVEVWESAEGGAIPAGPPPPPAQPQAQAEAPMGEVLAAALHDVQDNYELKGDRAALPGTDREHAQNVQSFHANEKALPPDQFDALIQSIDPDGTAPNHNGLAMQKLYSFYAARGDKDAAAQAAGGVLGAARQRSMEYGQDAVAALEKKDFTSASKALLAAYNEIPDGHEASGSVDERGVGKAVVHDIATGKLVREMPINPQVLVVAAQKLAGGGEFYPQLFPLAARKQAPRKALMAVGGSIVPNIDQEDVEFYNSLGSNTSSEDPEIEDARELGPDAEEPAAGSDSIPANYQALAGDDAKPVEPEKAVGAPQPPKPPKYVAPEDWMTTAQKKVLDAYNKREMEVYRQDMTEHRRVAGQLSIAERQEKSSKDRQTAVDKAADLRQAAVDKANTERQVAADKAAGVRSAATDKATAATQAAADKAAAGRVAAAATHQAATDERAKLAEKNRVHNDRYKNDPDYRRDYDLRRIDQQQAQLDENTDMGIDAKGVATRTAEERPGMLSERTAQEIARRSNETPRRLLDEERLAPTVRGKERDNYLNEPFKDRIKPYEEALQGVVTEGEENKKNGKVDERLLSDLYKPEFKNQKLAFLDLVDRVAAKNNVDPNTIVRSLFDVTQMVNPQNSMAINKDGRVQIGRERVFMDRDDFRKVAEIRGDNLDTWRKNAEEQKKMNKETEGKRQVGVATRRQTIDDIDAAGGGIGVDAGRPAPQRASGARGKYYMRRHAEELGVGQE